ncbi:PhzF family phenazine biosynthesis protein [Spirosoma litoris]
MKSVKFYIVDVFASQKYQGNQLAVFLDLEDSLSQKEMQQITKEINFAESAFIKENKDNQRFVVKIFTPEQEVPFAGHPSLGTSYIIAKFILPKAIPNLVLELAHSDIDITIFNPENLDDSLFFMRQAQPEFRDTFTREEVSKDLGISLNDIDTSLPIQEISTGLPYILIPLTSLAAMERLSLTYDSFKEFLVFRNRHQTNSPAGHSTSLFFFTKETYESGNTYNSRMLLLENNKLLEDAATGSANGCFLAYLLAHMSPQINVTVEQGFQIGRKSHLYLDGKITNGNYQLNVGGRNKLISEGVWYV